MGLTALWAVCVALVAAAPIAGGIGSLARGPDGLSDPSSLGDAWGDLMAASPPEPEPTSAPTDPEDGPQTGERVVQADLLAAPVPSLCGHPEGVLEDGLLPGLESGVVWIFTNPSGAIPAGRVAYGPLDDGPDTGAAVAVYCDQGGVSWPESVVLYGPGPEYLGHVVLSDLAPGRQKVEWISISRGVVTVRFTETYAADETGSRGRLDGTVTLRLRDGELIVSEPELVDERPTALEALRAAQMGDTESLRTVATSDAATELLRRIEESPDATIGGCSSPLAGAPDGTRATCTLVDSGGVVANLHLSRLRFATWQLIEVATPPSEVVAG